MSRAKRQYTRPTKYAVYELALSELADLETDLRCAKRDGLTAYAMELEAKIAKLRGHAECSVCRRIHGPEVTHACE